ncbi:MULTISPECIES: ABC transporter ATP-binding protein [Halocynthiibacter]|uniref:ABC transporter ATP-binding protein/permease n=1 Tax=Halocynthiibacter halioticoli TaxID=2986804 RepID=A0AAE3LTN4_9RHOB|nr:MULTISPECIES: ABC transporter ATP-binding protein [Halocynthiibacter]MCV6825416.1 ABC transporter ATP-binding protein/permease [Halocynthiibacter halioticoli]MCW4058417.1 ABC transporter ATP-binding protein/permease [Halocynthiibacter sp. SDUM655004]
MKTKLKKLFGALVPLRDPIIKRLLKESMALEWRQYGIAMVAMVVVAITTALTAWSMEGIVNALTESEGSGHVYSVALMIVGIFSLKGVATYIQTVFMQRAGNRIVARKQNELFEKMLQQGAAYYNTNESSGILNRLTKSVRAARSLVETIVVSYVRDLLSLIGLVAVMYYQQPVLSLVTLIFGPVAVLGVRKLISAVRDVMSNEMAAHAKIIKLAQESMQGARVIKVFDLEGEMRGQMRQAVSDVENRANKIVRLQAITGPLMETLAGFAIAGILIVSTLKSFNAQPLSAGELMSFVTALMMAYEPAKRLSRMRVSIETKLVITRQLFELIDAPLLIEDQPNAKPLPEGDGEVRFEDVSFGYREDKPILNHINLTFEAGKMTALVGSSGGGKSSILNLIMRLYDPSEGSVKINNMDLRDATMASIHREISFVDQDTFLFSSTVFENIKCSRPDATDEEVYAAARAASAEDFIKDLHKGYKTPVGENGAFLSGGQKQRLAIARALLRNSKILILDEATSALDANSETRVKSALQSNIADRTTIVVAHRLSTVMNADMIYVLDQGEVIEAGRPSDLLNQNGPFRALVDQQFESAAGENTETSST